MPEHLPIVRMIDPSLTLGMVQYLALTTLRYHRGLPEIERRQLTREWGGVQISPGRVGIMGIGELGSGFARMAVSLGFDTAGWSRREKAISGVTCFCGEAGLDAFLARTDILICLLPLTPQTRGILNSTLFARLPTGAYLIHVGRGEHLVEDDLLAALAQGKIKGATLDVFAHEPLNPQHPFWSHPDILVTPHLSSATSPATAAQGLCSNIVRIRSGKVPDGLVNRSAGY